MANERNRMIGAGYVIPEQKASKPSRTIAGGYVLPSQKKKQAGKPIAAITPPKPRPPAVAPTASITPPVEQPNALAQALMLGGGAPAAPGGASWFDMFAGAPQLGASATLPIPSTPPISGAPTQPQVQPTQDPLAAFLAGQAGQQQSMIPPFDIVGAINALRSEGPVAEFNKLASLPSYAEGSQSPFATGYFNQPSQMGLSPEAVLASQGNTATNQWAQMGGVPNLNPELLRRLNMGAAGARRPY